MEEKATRAYDLAALKYWGPSSHINFTLGNYQTELEGMKNMSRLEYVAHLRRKSSGFSRGASMYRGVTRSSITDPCFLNSSTCAEQSIAGIHLNLDIPKWMHILHLDKLNHNAEENQGQGTNPPLVEPAEPLPRTYNQLPGTNTPTKTRWPELEGVTLEEAEKKIKEDMAGVEIQVVPPGYFVTADFKSQRVRLYVDESQKVTRTPIIG